MLEVFAVKIPCKLLESSTCGKKQKLLKNVYQMLFYRKCLYEKMLPQVISKH